MPLRYLLLATSGGGIEECRLAEIADRTGLAIAHRSPKLIILTNRPDDVLVLPGGKGAVIGHLFHRYGSPRRIREWPSEAGTNILATKGRHLIDRYWGSYVACFEPGDGSVSVLRDPSGGLPCYHARAGGGLAAASDGPILIDAGFAAPSIDWRQLGRALLFHHLPAEKTAIEGLSQVLGGCAVTLKEGAMRTEQYWSPWDFIAPHQARRSQSNTELLARAVSSTVAAWSSCFSRPLVGLSGGLDSSIVACGLAASGANLACVTLSTDDPQGDERRYAREMGHALGAEVLELAYRNDAIDMDRSVAEGVPVPCGKLQEQAYNRAIGIAVEQLEADAFFVGAGGDNVFYATHSARPLVDRYEAQGIVGGASSTLRDIAAITGASAWQVLKEAYRLLHPRDGQMRWTPLPDYLSRDFVTAEMPAPIEHPWFQVPSPVPLGKLGHVKLLMRAMNHIEHRDKTLGVPMISPLLSQPVVETCLGIPSWDYVEGGVDRAVARRAFSSSLPPRIAKRAGKGSPDGFICQFIERNRSEVASRLLDGLLAKQGLIDRPALEEALAARFKFREGDGPRIMGLLDTEAWARHWSSRTSSPRSQPRGVAQARS